MCYADILDTARKDTMWCYPAIPYEDFDGVVVYGNAPVILRSRFKSMHPNCPDRPGDTVYINIKRGCDSTAVKSPVHDTALCAGDTLWLQIPNSSLWGYDLVWQNTSSPADVIYHQGNPVPIRDTGVYIYNVYNLLNNDCPDREGDTIHVSYWPKPRPFLPIDTVEACGGSNNAPVFTITQPSLSVLWSDSSTNQAYKFAYQGDTIDKRYCTLKNVCGDSLRDSVVVHFLPPYAYLGGDSIIGCKGDTLLFDAGQWNSHLPNYQKLRYVWTLRGDTVLFGSIAETDSLALLNPDSAYLDPTQLQLVLPQDTGLLVVTVFNLSAESESDCPAATDTIDLQLYPWPDIDFFVRAGDTTICYYDSIELFLDRDSLVFSPDAYYIWLFDSVPYDTTADRVFYAADTGLYTVTGVNYCSRHSESFFLRHHPVERITVTLTDTTVCPDIPVSIDPTLKNYTGNRYVWFKSGGEGGGEGDDEGGGTYVTPRPNARFSQFKNPGEKPDNDNYNEWPWDYSAALWVDTPGGYVLYVMDTAGCMANYKYSVNTEDCTPQIEAPNVFTPNGDGVNDEFTLKTMEKLFNFEISIFNRWGQQVKSYKGKPEDFSWDGRFNSSLEAPDGVYFYFITYENYKGKKKKLSGAVTILR